MKNSSAEIIDEMFFRRPALEPCRDAVMSAFSLLLECFRAGGKVLVCGNGGSAALRRCRGTA